MNTSILAIVLAVTGANGNGAPCETCNQGNIVSSFIVGEGLSGGSVPSCQNAGIFGALELVRAYRSNQAKAAEYFEQKEIQVSGRFVKMVKKVLPPTDDSEVTVQSGTGKGTFVKLQDPAEMIEGAEKEEMKEEAVKEKKPKEVYHMLITPDGKAPIEVALTFIFEDENRCKLAQLYPGQYVSVKGKYKETLTAGEFQEVFFEKCKLVD